MNRSEELAKLLGIEPKKEIAMHCGTNCNRHNCIMDKSCQHYKPIGAYPDFTNPSNFIKLLDIFGNILFNGLENTINEMLWRLDKLNGSRYIANVKQQAQQTEWTY